MLTPSVRSGGSGTNFPPNVRQKGGGGRTKGNARFRIQTTYTPTTHGRTVKKEAQILGPPFKDWIKQC